MRHYKMPRTTRLEHDRSCSRRLQEEGSGFESRRARRKADDGGTLAGRRLDMRKQQVELRAQRAIERALAGGPDEDGFVEFKSIWPEPEKVFRQLAGHANAAGGQPILWVIGVDAASRRVVGVNRDELSTWLAKVQSHFDDRAPALITNVIVSVADDVPPVVALLFETDDGPYVVKHAKGTQDLEVPWREGTGTRSARRRDLLRLLVPTLQRPTVEEVSGTLSFSQPMSSTSRWGGVVKLFFAPATEGAITVPLHRCKFLLHLRSSGAFEVPIGALKLGGQTQTHTHVVLRGPEPLQFVLSGEGARVEDDSILDAPLRVELIIGTVTPDTQVHVPLTAKQTRKHSGGAKNREWELTG